MPKSLSHVVVFTDDLDAMLRFLTDVAKVPAVNPYRTEAEDVHELFGWPLEHAAVRGAFVGEGPGGVDILEIPEALRGTVPPGVRLLAVVNRDAAAAGAAAQAAGFPVRGPFATTAATGAPMSLVEVVAGGVAFELVQFG
ncbi:MAG TPA: VOC family protein [Acidimicrobiia bacterium]|nr:VOC family protein [Acidimicrobiia bacterium]